MVSVWLSLGGGFDKVVVLMEGESLFNDATSIVLFEIFFEMVKKLGEGSASMEGGILQEGLHIVFQIGWLAAGLPTTLSTTAKALDRTPWFLTMSDLTCMAALSQ